MELLPATAQNIRIFLEILHSPVHNMILQDAESSKGTKKRLACLLEGLNDIISTNLSDIVYIKHIGMDIEPDPNLPPVALKP